MYAALKPFFKTEITMGGFRNYFYREVPDWLEDLAIQEFDSGDRIRQTRAGATGKLKILGGIGAGGSPMSGTYEQEMEVPIEFAQQGWRAFVVESDARSMMPFIQPGDIVVLVPDKVAKLHKLMAIQDSRDPSVLYVKKVEHDGERTIFVSTNKNSSPLDMTGLGPVGRVVGIISGDGKLRIGPHEDGITVEYIHEQLGRRLPD